MIHVYATELRPSAKRPLITTNKTSDPPYKGELRASPARQATEQNMAGRSRSRPISSPVTSKDAITLRATATASEATPFDDVVGWLVVDPDGPGRQTRREARI